MAFGKCKSLNTFRSKNPSEHISTVQSLILTKKRNWKHLSISARMPFLRCNMRVHSWHLKTAAEVEKPRILLTLT